MNQRGAARPRQLRAARAATVVAALALAAGAALTGCAASTTASAGAARTAGAGAEKPTPPAVELAAVQQAEASAQALATAPGMPACTPPPLPAATYPPGASYGIPFLAAITGGQILAGYDEWTANHHVWRVGKKTYHLYPWQAKISGITGWVAGLLQLPSLSATVAPSGVVFCDGGGQACESASPPVGECIWVVLRGAPVPGQAPARPTTNIPAPGKPCYQQTILCIPYVVTLDPVGDTSLTVTGVGADGSLQLGVTTSASTTLSITLPNNAETCQDSPATLALSSQEPAALPAGAPVRPKAGNPDFRRLRVRPAPLTGPLGTATTTLATDDFSVPAFSTKACPLLAAVFDAPLAGWNALPSQDPATKTNNYFDKSPPPADAGNPGWVQFSATTTISDLGLPVGPPSGLSAPSPP